RSIALLPGSPEDRHGVPGHDRHLDPALLVVGGASVGGGQVVVGRDDAADEAERLDTQLAGEDLVLAHPAVDAGELVPAHTARPHISSASRPSRVMRAAVQGGSHTMLQATSVTPGSRSRRSRTSSRMKSDAGQPMAVNVRSTVTWLPWRRTS